VPTLSSKISQNQVLLGSMGSFEHKGKVTTEMTLLNARGSIKQTKDELDSISEDEIVRIGDEEKASH